MAGRLQSRTRSWLLVFGAFVIIAALLTTTYGAVLHETRKVQEQVRAITQNAMTSTLLVSRMGRAIYLERLLVDAHIFEREAGGMGRVEGRIAAVQAEYAAAARAYEPLATFPGEPGAWQQLKRDVAALRAPLGEALALSRQNRDAEARAALLALEGRFAAVQGDEADLLGINQRGAEGALAQVAGLQRWTTTLLAALALVGAVLTVLIGTVTTRLVRQREDEGRRYSDMLETRNRELDAFAGRVAHDLRGPLTTIGLAASVFARRPPDDASVAILRRGVTRMEELIEDLLALSRVDEDGAHHGVCDPALVAAQIGDDFAPRLEAERVALRVAVEPATVRCAEGLLRQVLANLTDNAVKYRRPETPAIIEIAGRPAARGYELRVTDNGTGMTPDEARQAFEPFYRSVRVREQQGTGLGLSIVKRVVEASGGTIAVDSRLGEGTTLVIHLALAPAAPDAAPG